MKISMASRNEIINVCKKRYVKANKSEKIGMLDELTLATGLSRDHLARKLRGPAVSAGSRRRSPYQAKPLKRQGRKAKYGIVHREALIKLWTMLGCIASKRFVAALPALMEALTRSGHRFIPEEIEPDLKHISARTVDRLLAYERSRYLLKGRPTTKPGTLLKSQIPIRRGTDWDDAAIGFCEIDLVAHCGPSARGEFIFTLTVTDVRSGWTECRAVINKAQRHVFEALLQVRSCLPFPLKGIDSDNGSEFINVDLLRYCEAEDLVFTRSRPETSNDGCYVEQKNWSVVRQNVGYQRYEGHEALNVLNQYYEILRLMNNFFLPSAKLIEKQRDKAKLRRKHDQPQTPYQRLLKAKDVSKEVKEKLNETFLSLDPYLLSIRAKDLLSRLACYAISMNSNKSSERNIYS